MITSVEGTPQSSVHVDTLADPHPPILDSCTKRGTAVYLDLDNLLLAASSLGLKHCKWGEFPIQLVLRRIEDMAGNRLTLCRAYGDVNLQGARVHPDNDKNPRSIRHRIAVDLHMQHSLHNNGFKVIHTPSFSGKNRADILMSLECLRRVRNDNHLGTVVIGSNDSDVCPLIQELQAIGKNVILLTVRTKANNGAGQAMKHMANEHIVVDQQFIDQNGYHALQSVVKCLITEHSDQMTTRGVHIDHVESCIKKIYRQFDHKDLGYNTVYEFIKDCIDKELILEKGRLKLRETAAISSGASSKAKFQLPLTNRTKVNKTKNSDSNSKRDQSPQQITKLPSPDNAIADNIIVQNPKVSSMADADPENKLAEYVKILKKKQLYSPVVTKCKLITYLKSHLFDSLGSPTDESLTVGRIASILIEHHSSDEEISSTAVRGLLNLLITANGLLLHKSNNLRYRERLALKLVRNNDQMNDLLIKAVTKALRSAGRIDPDPGIIEVLVKGNIQNRKAA